MKTSKALIRSYLMKVSIMLTLFAVFVSSSLTYAGGIIIIDGSSGDWSSISPLATNTVSGKAVKAHNNESRLFLQVEGTGLNVKGQFFIDADHNTATGFNVGGWSTNGADYLIENAIVYKNEGGGWSWNQVGVLQTTDYVKNDTVVELSIPLSMLGLTTSSTIDVGYIVNDSATDVIPAAGGTLPSYALVATTPPAASTGNWDGIRNYLVNYAGDAVIDGDLNMYADYDAIVLEPDSDVVSVQTLRNIRDLNAETFLIGYISIGETREILTDANGDPLDIYFTDANGDPLENLNWHSYYIDANTQLWRDMVINELLPAIYAKGYDGVFLDTVDTSIFVDPSRNIDFSASSAGMATLINDMKTAFPDKKIIMNRGFHLLNGTGDSLDVAGSIDGLMFESFTTTWASSEVDQNGMNVEWYHAYPADSNEYIWSDGIANQINKIRFQYNSDGTVKRDQNRMPVKSAKWFHGMTHDYAKDTTTEQVAIMQTSVDRAWANGFVPSMGTRFLNEAPTYDWKALVTGMTEATWGSGLDIQSMPLPNPIIDDFTQGVGNWKSLRGVTDPPNPDSIALAAENGLARLDMTVLGTSAWKNAAKMLSKEWFVPVDLSEGTVTLEAKASTPLTAGKSFEIELKDYNNDVKVWTNPVVLSDSFQTVTMNPAVDGTYIGGWDGAKDGFQADKVKSIEIRIINTTDLSPTYSGSLYIDNLVYHDTVAPSAPTGLTAVSGDTQAGLTWNANAESDVQGYHIYQNGVKITSSPVTGTSHIVTGLTNGTAYSFRITAVDSGNESAQSTAISVTPGAISSGIVIDGVFTDWSPVSSIATGSSEVTKLKVYNTKWDLYLYAEGTGLNAAKAQFFIDIDNDTSTGFDDVTWGVTGADYLVEGGLLYEYVGVNNSWAWHEIDDLRAYQYAATSTGIEVSLGLDYLGWIEPGDTIRVGYIKGDSATHRLPGSGGILPSYTLSQ